MSQFEQKPTSHSEEWRRSPSGSPSSSTGENLRERAGHAAQEIKHKAASAFDRVQETAGDALRERKSATASSIHRVAAAVRDASGRLHDESDTAGRYVDMAAERLDEVAEYLGNHDVKELRADAEDAVRRHAAVFMVAAFVGGVLLGRFLRSSAQHEHGEQGEQGSDIQRRLAPTPMSPMLQPSAPASRVRPVGAPATPGVPSVGGRFSEQSQKRPFPGARP